MNRGSSILTIFAAGIIFKFSNSQINTSKITNHNSEIIKFVLMKIYKLHICALVVALLLFSACRTHYKVDHLDHASVEMYDSVMVDSSLLEIIEEYKAPLDSSMNVIVGYSEVVMQKGQPESILGNFICDLILEVCIEQFGDTLPLQDRAMVVMNNGGFRSSLPMGAITIGDVYRLMPFDNEVVILRMPGPEMDNVFSGIAVRGGVPVAGIELILRADEYRAVYFNGNEYDENLDYYVITSDYLADGGDDMSGFDKNTGYIHTGLLVRDVIIDYFKAMTANAQTANPEKDGRIRYE
ncbi:MAG: hypothetical protein C0592_03850 [Marinilabiliales bacterium]|nr:MAG: hypothetical protein C0592_03850 [Marinilabiliales bacterium]